MLITVFTGMMIASCTLLLAFAVSKDFREYVKNYENVLSKVEKLEKRIAEVRKKERMPFVYKYQDTLLSVVIKPEPDTNKMKRALKEVVYHANQAALQKSRQVAREYNQEFNEPVSGKLVAYIPSNLNDIARELSRLKGEQVIFARAYKNSILGDRFPVQLGKPIPNKVVYRKGELIYQAKIRGNNYLSILDGIQRIIRNEIGNRAIIKGLFPNPDDGSIGEFDANKLKKISEKIAKKKGDVIVQFFAMKDTKILGPLAIEVKIKE